MAIDSRLTVSISSGKNENLSPVQRQFLAALEDRIQARGLRILPDSASSDDLTKRFAKMRMCHGVVVFAFSQWQAERLNRKQNRKVLMPSEFNHMAAVQAQCAKRPLLVLREKALAERGAFRSGYLPHVVRVPASLNVDWLDSPEFRREFNKWIDEINCFQHVFLGYSSKATNLANAVYKFLAENLKVRVFDWHDFRPGDTIWESIERAERLTTCGLFLFMADDRLAAGESHEFAPRDNVVYEAGYFAGAKGRRRSLVIREEGAKVPSDLGGILYIPLRDRAHLSPIETPLREHLERMLNGID
jgi:Predicted nucleotide-binding protein containing TIR-like domain